jgi:hypothetical protein
MVLAGVWTSQIKIPDLPVILGTIIMLDKDRYEVIISSE